MHVIGRQPHAKHKNIEKKGLCKYEQNKNIKEKGKLNKEKGHDKHCTHIKWLNSLRSPVELPTVATYPSAGGRGEIEMGIFQKNRTRGSRHQFLFEENTRKTKKKGLRILKIKVRELFTHGEGVSTPRARHKGQQPLIKYA